MTWGRVPRCTRPRGFLSHCRQDTLLRGAGQCEEPRGGGAAPFPLPPVSSTGEHSSHPPALPCPQPSANPTAPQAMPPFPGDAGTPCVPCSVPGAPWGLRCCRARAQQGCAASCPQSCGFPLPPAPCPGGRAALPVPPRTPRIAFLLGCQQFLGLPPARGRAASGSSGHSHQRSPSAACGRSRAFHFAHALSLDCNLPMHLYVHSCTHRRVCKYKCTGGAATGRGCTSGFAPSRVLFSPSTLLVVALPKPGVGCFYCSLYS